MPSDVNEVIAQVNAFCDLLQDEKAQFSDVQMLFNKASQLERDLNAAKEAAEALRKIFADIRGLTQAVVKEPKVEDKRLIGGTLKDKSDRKNKPEEIRKKIKELNANLLTDFSPFGTSIAASLVLESTDASPKAGKPEASSDGTSSKPDEGAVEMQRFFTDVTESLIGAQTELNRQSLEYAARLDRRIPPAYYSIPSLKAEMKVGFSEEKGKGMNLILFSSREQRERYGESTLSFELVSVPPPPGSERPELPPGFLLTDNEKKRFLDKVHQLAEDKHLDVKLTDNFNNGVPLAAVLRYSEKADEVKFLVFWPAQTERDKEKEDFWRNLLVLHLSETNGDLQPDLSIFDSNFFPKLGKDNQYLLIPDTAGLNKLRDNNPDGLVALVNCFGDAVFKVLKIFDEYYKAKPQITG